ncbi:MAG: WxcM-like domain-containing protein, partial [Gammaproteobacteria bacterium]|nr:WxcM-like domain-containing protein [Gammaproteobacteria bacterium]
SGVRRGLHAHRKLKQIAVCVHGSCRISLDDGKNKKDILLDSPNKGLLIEGLVWREMYDFSADSVLMVIADDYYNEEDYIRDYDTFLREAN